MEELRSLVETTGKGLLNKLRVAVSPPGKKGLWLRHLSDQRLAEVYHRLKLGQPCYRVAKIAQTEWGVMKDSNLKSLSRAVHIFRDKTIDLITIEKSTSAVSDKPERRAAASAFEKRAKRIKKGLDGMGRLAWLVDVQTDRVCLMLERERLTQPTRQTDRSMVALKESLVDYLRLAIELGIEDSKPPELHLKIKHRFEGLLQHAIQGDGSRMLSAADRFLELAEQNSLTMQMGDDGAYHTPDAETEEEDDSEYEEPSEEAASS